MTPGPDLIFTRNWPSLLEEFVNREEKRIRKTKCDLVASQEGHFRFGYFSNSKILKKI